jgi:hypothetical protein
VREEGLSRPPWAILALLVSAKIAIAMAVADHYGWHRDEFYYLASSKHLALGYVDYPPLTPLLAAVDQLIFPRSLPGLRLLAVLASAAIIVIAALIARELDGNRTAQALAAGAVLISPEFIGTNFLFQTVAFDEVMWALACWVFVRLLMGANPREWLLLGLIFGIGVETKYTIIGLGVAMLIGLLATPQRRLLASRWPYLGLGLAALLLVPNLTWQVSHHWDSVAYTLTHRGATDGPILYWVEQVLLVGPPLIPMVVGGVLLLWRHERLRAAAVTVIAVELFFFLVGGKAYYPAPIYPLAYAAGAIWLLASVKRASHLRRSVAIALAITLVLLPLGLPVLPTRIMVKSGIWQARKDFADMIGWPELTKQVTDVYQQIPVSERQSVMILASNYGEAGALQYYGQGLPTVVCAHLTYYYWAPAQMHPSIIIVIGYPRDYLVSLFGDVQQAATISNSFGIHNEEFGQAIWIVRNPRHTLSQVFPQLKALD